MRVLYPDIVYGAISSSGVVHATLDDFYYFDIIRRYAGPPGCMERVSEAIVEVDDLLADNSTRTAIKEVFGLQGISYDPDFASLLSVRAGFPISLSATRSGHCALRSATARGARWELHQCGRLGGRALTYHICRCCYAGAAWELAGDELGPVDQQRRVCGVLRGDRAGGQRDGRDGARDHGEVLDVRVRAVHQPGARVCYVVVPWDCA